MTNHINSKDEDPNAKDSFANGLSMEEDDFGDLDNELDFEEFSDLNENELEKELEKEFETADKEKDKLKDLNKLNKKNKNDDAKLNNKNYYEKKVNNKVDINGDISDKKEHNKDFSEKNIKNGNDEIDFDELEKDLDLEGYSDFDDDELDIDKDDLNDNMFNEELEKIESQIVSQDKLNHNKVVNDNLIKLSEKDLDIIDDKNRNY